jgi:electron transfer flavoprotein alpha subunit
MAILLIAEHDNSSLSDQTGKALTAALKIGADVHVLVAGKNAKAAADAASKLSGVTKVLLAEADELENRLAEPLAATIVGMAGSYDTIVAPATTSGKNVMPRVAALLDVAQVSEIIEVVSPDTFKRPIYAGNAIQTVQATDAKKVITVRTAGFQATGEGGSAPVETVAAAANPGLSSFVENKLSASERPELTSAKIIISGGRALGSSEKLCAERLAGRADRLGGGAGALHRCRHLRRNPAPRRHEGLQGDRRHQQGRGGANLPGRRLRHCRRSLRHPAGAREGALIPHRRKPWTLVQALR